MVGEEVGELVAVLEEGAKGGDAGKWEECRIRKRSRNGDRGGQALEASENETMREMKCTRKKKRRNRKRKKQKQENERSVFYFWNARKLKGKEGSAKADGRGKCNVHGCIRGTNIQKHGYRRPGMELGSGQRTGT